MRSLKKYIFLSLTLISVTGQSKTTFNHVINDHSNFHLVVLVEYAPVEIFSPETSMEFKRGQVIEIRWSGGKPDDEYALDLYDGRYHYRHIGELKNSGVYPWIIPKDVSHGNQYRFKLTNINDFSDFSFGETFIIKRKVPVVAWIIPGGIIVTGAVILLLQNDPSSGPSDLPIPIDP